MVLHDSSKCRLSILCHTVRLVENDDFERRSRVRPSTIAREGSISESKFHHDDLRIMIMSDGSLRKVLDFVSYYTDSSFVGSVQFENSRTIQFRSEELLAEGENGRSLSSTWRSIEEHMRELQSESY